MNVWRRLWKMLARKDPSGIYRWRQPSAIILHSESLEERWMPSAGVDLDSFAGDTTKGWGLTNLQGGTPPGATLSTDGQTMNLQYQRENLTGLIQSVLLTELKEIRLTLRSDSAITLAMAITDRDDAEFTATFNLPAGEMTTVIVRPTDFILNPGSPVQKPGAQPARFFYTYVLLDTGAGSGASGTNTLKIDDVVVERTASVVQTGTWIIDQPTTVTQSTFRDGNIEIHEGGSLKVTAPRFTIRGNIIAQNSQIQITGGVFNQLQRFSHEYGTILSDGARLSLKDAVVLTHDVGGLALEDTSRWKAKEADFFPGITVDATAESRTQLDRVSTVGEIITQTGHNLSISRSNTMLIWLTLESNYPSPLNFPATTNVDRWKVGSGFNVRIKDSQNVSWAIISMPNSNATVQNANLAAAGIGFHGNTQVTLDDIRNGRFLADFTFPSTDRSLHFLNSTVTAWNFYANDDTQVTVQNSKIGELFQLHNSFVTVRDSEIDGSGGYISADSAFLLPPGSPPRMYLLRTTITTLVVAKNVATITLQDSAVTGNVYATGASVIRLLNTPVNGSVTADPGAMILYS